MNLYLITQDENNGYDTYDSAVVCATNSLAAQCIHPNNQSFKEYMKSMNMSREVAIDNYLDSWTTPENVRVIEIGVAHTKIKSGIVCSSFNAS